jgi:CheY-like chemotaxis protein
MDALGGLCGVEDRYDGKEGSRFWFSFPYRPDEASAMQSQIELISSAVTMQRSASGSNLIGIGSIGSNIHLLDLFPRESSTQHTGRASFSRKYTDSSSKKGSLKCDEELFGASMEVEIIKGVDKDDSKLISVLLVDDSVPILKMCAKNLENSGFKVTLAKNGADALNILKERCRDFHVVLTDLQMPVMDGLECVKRFRKFECYNEFPITDHPGAKYEHRLPIIGMSANSCDETKNAALSSGMDHFIPKPFKLETFEEVLAQLCPQFVESRKLAILQALENIDEDDDNDDFGSVLSKILPLVPENLLSGIVPFLPVEILPTLIAQLPPSLLLVVIPSLPTNVILDLIPLLPEETALAVKARLPTGISSQINLPDLSIISEDEEDDANEILQPSVVPKSKKLSFCTTNSMCTLNTSVTSVEDGLSSSQPTFRKGSGLMNTPRGKKSMVMVELINNLSNETMCSVLPYLTNGPFSKGEK